jgi:predicted dehydrogenase
MLKIGIVGAESSHAAGIAKLCNVKRRVDARVEMLWGETDEFAQKTAAAGRIPLIVKDWREMLGKVDGVIIDHRHAKYHFEPAKFFLSNGVPAFLDNAFTYTLAEGRKLFDIARRRKTPVTGFSSVTLQKDFSDFKAAAARLGEVYSLATSGPADVESKWGGLFFYGVHQANVIAGLLGPCAGTAQLIRHGSDAVGILTYAKGPMVTMTCLNREGFWDAHWSVLGKKGRVDWTPRNDAEYFLKAMQIFLKMIKTRKQPFEAERILAPIAILEAMTKSLEIGRPVKVGKV